MLDCLSALDFSSLDAHAFCKNLGFAYAAENIVSLCSTDGCAPSHEGGERSRRSRCSRGYNRDSMHQ